MTRFTSILAALLVSFSEAYALTTTGYSSAANDLYSSGYPSSPVRNSGTSFVGYGGDFSGIGWSSADATKSFVFLSPIHFSATRHYGGATTISLFGGDGTLYTGTQAQFENTGVGGMLSGQTTGDMALGTLAAPIYNQLPRYAVIDANLGSATNTPANYTGATSMLVGRGPNGSSSTRVGLETLAGYSGSGSNMVIATFRTNTQLEVGDSGSPGFYGWINPNGDRELTLLGNNLAISGSYNVLNFFGTYEAINAHNALMTADGYALRVAGPTSANWDGAAAGGDFSATANWSSGVLPTDLYVLFTGSTASNRQIHMNSAGNLRGLYFKATPGSDGFSFSGTSPLTIGRGGITNYDGDVQTFNAPLQLGDHQYWDAGSGGINANAIDTNGKLLEIAGSGTTTISGAISGTGSLAFSGSRLILSGSSSYTGKTWVHTGLVTVNGEIASRIAVEAGAKVGGSGKVSAIEGAGSVDPGNSPGILTATSVDPSTGMDFNFEFTLAGSPLYSNAAASGNDLLTLTGTTPFSNSLAATNAINIYLNGVGPGDTFRGGFFTAGAWDLGATVENASFNFYLASESGSVVYNGVNYDLLSQMLIGVSIVQVTADFASGFLSGSTMEFQFVPEPSSAALLALGGLLFCRRRSKR